MSTPSCTGPAGTFACPSRRAAVLAAFVACAAAALAPATEAAGPQARTTATGAEGGTIAPAEPESEAPGGARPPAGPVTTHADLTRLQRRLHDDIRRLTGASVDRGASRPQAQTLESIEREGYRLDTIELLDDGTVLRGMLATPDGDGRKPTTLLLAPTDMAQAVAPGSDLDLLAVDGGLVLLLEPRATPAADSRPASPPSPGSSPVTTPLGTYIDDVMRAVAWLRERRDVDRAITIHGRGGASLVALHAAVLLGTDVDRLVLEDMPASYRMTPATPARVTWSDVMAGLPDAYDVGDLLMASFPQRLAIVTPVGARGERLTATTFASLLGHVFESDRRLRDGNDDLARIAVLFLE